MRKLKSTGRSHNKTHCPVLPCSGEQAEDEFPAVSSQVLPGGFAVRCCPALPLDVTDIEPSSLTHHRGFAQGIMLVESKAE